MNISGFNGTQGQATEPIMSHIRKVVKTILKKEKTLAELSRKVKISTPYLCQFLKAKRGIGIIALIRFYRKYDLDLNSLKKFDRK